MQLESFWFLLLSSLTTSTIAWDCSLYWCKIPLWVTTIIGSHCLHSPLSWSSDISFCRLIKGFQGNAYSYEHLCSYPLANLGENGSQSQKWCKIRKMQQKSRKSGQILCCQRKRADIFLLFSQILSVCLVAQSCPTLCNPMDCSLPGSSVHGHSPGKNPGVSCSPPGDVPNPGIKPRTPTLQVDSLPSEPPDLGWF